MACLEQKKDIGYQKVKEQILKTVLLVGMAATLVGGLYNAFNGYNGIPVYIHLAGFILLLALLLSFRRADKARITIIALSYFCFIYTPFAWITLGGVYSSMTHVTYVFFLLISFLLDGRTNTCFTLVYAIEIFLLVIANSVLMPPVDDLPLFPETFSYLVMLVILIAVSIVYKRQFTKYLLRSRRDSITDMLTGLNNHRYLTDVLQELSSWCNAAPGRDYAVAVVDLDDFKAINDTYGHSTGDDVLHELGELLANNFREHIVGRYGGDEFLAIFKNVPFSRCVMCCEALMDGVRSRTFTDQGIRISLSIGLCSYSQLKGGSDLFAEADRLLYKAKENRKSMLYYETNPGTM